MEQIIKKFETKQEALDFMHFMSAQQITLVNHPEGWLVVWQKNINLVEGELDVITT